MKFKVFHSLFDTCLNWVINRTTRGVDGIGNLVWYIVYLLHCKASCCFFIYIRNETTKIQKLAIQNKLSNFQYNASIAISSSWVSKRRPGLTSKAGLAKKSAQIFSCKGFSMECSKKALNINICACVYKLVKCVFLEGNRIKSKIGFVS